MLVIIYMYLAIIISLSIITGIITTIIEKKESRRKKKNSKITMLASPGKVLAHKIKKTIENTIVIPIIQADNDFLSKTMNIMGLTRKMNQVEIEESISKDDNKYAEEPVILAIIDEDII